MTSLDPKSLAAHVIVTLADAQSAGLSPRIDELAASIGVRKADVRSVVSSLHHEGHVDAMRLRLTLSGLALASAFGAYELKPTRTHQEVRLRVA